MKVLIAEDDRVSCRALQSLLRKWGYEVIAATDGTQAWNALREEDRPPLAILDWLMPGMDGLEVCRMVRRQQSEPYVYVLMLTAKADKSDIVEGLEAGADDYLTKPFNPQELRVRLRAGRRIVELQSQLIRARESLKDRATHDPLTGLLNRSLLDEILQQEMARSARQGTPLAVMIADLDHFKDINDHRGHMAGDGVLQGVAGRLKSSVRCYDRVFRYGGEEFLFVLPGCAGAAALLVAERVRAIVGREPVDTSEGLVSVSVSIGVAATPGGRKMDPQVLTGAADAALYRAKREGRNRVELAPSERAGRRQ